MLGSRCIVLLRVIRFFLYFMYNLKFIVELFEREMCLYSEEIYFLGKIEN